MPKQKSTSSQYEEMQRQRDEARADAKQANERADSANRRAEQYAKHGVDEGNRSIASQQRAAEAEKQLSHRNTVLKLAIERTRIAANDAIVAYDKARGELSRLTCNPTYALGESLLPFGTQLP